MKILKTTYTLLALVAVTLLTACSADNTEESESRAGQEDDGLCTVGLRISAAGGNGVTRAADGNATDAEMMNLWTVVAVNHSDKKVAFIHACKPGSADREIDDLVKLEAGTYDFYSFANIPPSVVYELMGITGLSLGAEVTRSGNENGSGNDNNNDPDVNPTSGGSETGQGEAIPSYSETTGNDPIANISEGSTDVGKVFNLNFTDGAAVDADAMAVKEVGMNGNGFNIAGKNAFNGDGIPMSNKQTITISSSTSVDLIVVRMFAKIEVRLYNETASDIKVKSVTLSDVNGNFNNNIKLLPKLSNGNDMEVHHGDIEANVGVTTYTGDYTCTPASAVTVPANTLHTGSSYETISFYVNESATPANAEGLFYLTLEMENAGTSEFRYALISDNPANHWNYIARNDYRIIRVVLDDLKFEIIPYDFPPIGVYPVSVKEVDAAEHIYDFTFHDYGHFHLLPSVTKGGTPVEFSAATPTGSGYKWTLIDNLWDKSWFTYAAKGDALQTANPGDFYRTGTGSTTVDGDDEGQTPAWYPNTTGNPQWDPAASGNYHPFIFGYIADPGSALSEDKKVYHEMKIQVYNGTTAYRQMLYRFYMTLSAGQMLYAPSLVAPAPRRPHWQ